MWRVARAVGRVRRWVTSGWRRPALWLAVAAALLWGFDRLVTPISWLSFWSVLVLAIIAAFGVAVWRARGRVATVAVNAFLFKQPVHIGDVLSFYADIVRVGTTSITVNVEVYAQRRPTDVETVKVTEATLTYVATGDDRRPRPVPPES